MCVWSVEMLVIFQFHSLILLVMRYLYSWQLFQNCLCHSRVCDTALSYKFEGRDVTDSWADGQKVTTGFVHLYYKKPYNMYCLPRRHNSMHRRQEFSKSWLMPCRLGVTTMLACDHEDVPAEVTKARAVHTVDDRCHLNMGALKRGNVIVLAYHLCFAEL